MSTTQDVKKDPPPRIRHIDEMEWETIRWTGETGKMLFHPTPADPTAPNAGLLRLEPGSYHPWHRHDFAQVWYILEGEFNIGGKSCGSGSMLSYGDRKSSRLNYSHSCDTRMPTSACK